MGVVSRRNERVSGDCFMVSRHYQIRNDVSGTPPFPPVLAVPADPNRITITFKFSYASAPFPQWLQLLVGGPNGHPIWFTEPSTFPVSLSGYGYEFTTPLHGDIAASDFWFGAGIFTLDWPFVGDVVETRMVDPACVMKYIYRKNTVRFLNPVVNTFNFAFPGNPNRVVLLVSLSDSLNTSVDVSLGESRQLAWVRYGITGLYTYPYRDYGPLITDPIGFVLNAGTCQDVAITEVVQLPK